MTLVVPKMVDRKFVQVVGLKGRPELNGKVGTIEEFNETKGRYPVNLGNETVLIKMMNLMAISKSEQVTKLLLAQGRMQPAPWQK